MYTVAYFSIKQITLNRQHQAQMKQNIYDILVQPPFNMVLHFILVFLRFTPIILWARMESINKEKK